MNPAIQKILAAVICVAVAGFFLKDSKVGPQSAPSAESAQVPAQSTRSISTTNEREVRIDKAKSAVYAMLDAADEGDTREYLRWFAGKKGRELKATADERGQEQFGQALAQVNAGIKGIVLYEVEEVSRSRVEMKCELIFQDHNEKQLVKLEQSRAGWRITELEALGSFQMARPYGSPVAPLQPPPAQSAGDDIEN